MHLRVIQVNIYLGKYLDKLIDFLGMQNADVITLQEVSSGELNLCSDRYNLFEVLKKSLNYQGVFYPTSSIEDKPSSFIGNAILTKHFIKNSNFIPLKAYASMVLSSFRDPEMFENIPRGITEAMVRVNGRDMFILSCHGAWTAPPHDTRENLRQAKLIAKHLGELNLPFIMGADMNMSPKTRVIKTLEGVALNLNTNGGIMQTTHPTVHKIAPKGYLVDYIFTSEEFKKISIAAPNVLVSDHLPLVAELELRD